MKYIVLVVIVTALVIFSYLVGYSKRGDINRDGVINALDITALEIMIGER